MAKKDDLEIVKEQVNLIKSFYTPLQDILKPAVEIFKLDEDILGFKKVMSVQEEAFSKAIKESFQTNDVFKTNQAGLKALLENKAISSDFLQMKNRFANVVSSALKEGIINTTKNILNTDGILGIKQGTNNIVTQSYIDIIKNLNNSISEIYKDIYFYKTDEVNYDDIMNLVNDNYLNDDLTINEETYDKASDEEKTQVKKVLDGFYKFIARLVMVLAMFDSPTLQYLVTQVPIISQVYSAIIPDKIETNGHITSKTADIYSYSSLSSYKTDKLEYGIPFEVKVYHSGWLKIKYTNINEEITEGWVQEDKVVWSYTND